MKQWIVYFETGAGWSVEVEAETAEEAEELASEEGPPGLCHQCSEIGLGDWTPAEVAEVE